MTDEDKKFIINISQELINAARELANAIRDLERSNIRFMAERTTGGAGAGGHFGRVSGGK